MNINHHILIKITGLLLTIGGICLLPAIFTSYFFEEPQVMNGLLLSALIMLSLGLSAFCYRKPSSTFLKFKDGYFMVTFCWLVMSLFGALPYYFSGYVPNFIDAFFESVAGFTTTGCTVLDLNRMPHGLMMWKAISHWLGGMGILVFVISILPNLGAGGQKIVKAEAPGPKLDKMATRISDSTKLLYLTYIAFTIIQFVLLSLGPMNPYEAFINSMGSVSTGGLFTHPEGIAYYDSFYIEAVLSLFMVLSSINFILYSYAIRGKWGDFFRDLELRVFFGILAVSILLVGFGLYFFGTYDSLFQSLRYALFQVISFCSTSGFAVCDYTTWPTFCIAILFLLMFVGGCAASTCGSVKVIRIIVLFKLIGRGFYKRLHPRAVVAVKMGEQTLPAPMVSKITGFILAYFSVFLLTCLVLSLQNLDMETTISAAAAALSNTGIGLGELGASGNFGMFSSPLKLFLSLIMIMGRLEVFTILLLLTPSFWNSDR